MNILIRLDCSGSIGMGHFMRCVALASVLKKNGVRIVFVIRELENNKIEGLKAKGFEIYSLPINCQAVETSWKIDASETINFIEKLCIRFDWLIVDHYGLDAKWESCLQAHVNKLMIIDDLANRPHECELLLDQNFYSDQFTRYHNLIPKNTKLLLGPEYALLRPDFEQYRAISKERNGSLRKILIFFGGGDVANETIKAIRACKKLGRKDIEIDVVVGSACSKQDEIEDSCREISNARYFCQIDNIAELMASADLAIGAGGSTTWERCCLGLPSLVITIANNQVALTRELSLLGALKYLDETQNVSEEQITHAVLSLIDNPKFLSVMEKKSREIVDGKGCEKVANKLLECLSYG